MAKARRTLLQWSKVKRLNQRKISAATGLNQATLSRVLAGHNWPTPHTMGVLTGFTNGEVDWDVALARNVTFQEAIALGKEKRRVWEAERLAKRLKL